LVIAKFIKSATCKDQYPVSTLPKIAFLGRSNVGKSSLINVLVGQKGLARTSSSPGRTRIINFFEIDETYVFVDLPGYGFARVSRQVRAQWGPMIEEFLREDENLKLAVVIVDARRQPTSLDQMMVEWLRRYQLPFQLVASKTDKLSGNRRPSAVSELSRHFEVDSIISFSALRGDGRKELWSRIQQAASGPA